MPKSIAKTPSKSSSTKKKKCTDPVTQYAQDVSSGKILAGPYVRKACERHLKDLESKRWFFDTKIASDRIGFFEEGLRLYAGDQHGKPFLLMPWQQFVIGSIYGWINKKTGYRRFTHVYIETGKGSGKTPLAAGLCLISILADNERMAECYIIARNADQAKITFDSVVNLISQQDYLRKRLHISGGEHAYNISDQETKSFIRRLTTNQQGKGKSGASPHMVIIDEYHEHDSSAMYDFYRSGTKNRTQPLIVITTNAGAGKNTPCGLEHDFACRTLEGKNKLDSYFAYICALDKEDNPLVDQKCWIKTNPSLPLLPGKEYLKREINIAKLSPSKQAIILRLNFCQWTYTTSPWIDMYVWEKIQVDSLSTERVKCKCYIGIDLSLKTDLTAAALVWQISPDHLEAEVKIWTPQDSIDRLSSHDNVPYNQWVEQGYIEACPGNLIDYDMIAQWIRDINNTYDLYGIAFDPFNIDLLEQSLDKAGLHTTRQLNGIGLTIVPHPQSYVSGSNKVTEGTGLSMPRSIQDAEECFLNERIKVKINPCLTSSMSGAQTITDASNNRRFIKKQNDIRIDPAVALTMGIGLTFLIERRSSKITTARGLILHELFDQQPTY